MSAPVTGLRGGLLVLNLVLTLLIGGQTLLAVFHPPETLKLNRWPAPEDLRDTGAPTGPAPDMGPRIARIRDALEPRAPNETGRGGDVPPPPEPAVPPPGPLDANWEISMFIVTEDPQANWCVLQKKDPAAATRILPGSVRPPIRVPGGKVQRVPGQVPTTDKKTLQVNQRWVDEDLKIDIAVIDVTPWKMIYEDRSDPRMPVFELPRKSNSIYTDDGKMKKMKERQQ